MGKNTSW